MIVGILALCVFLATVSRPIKDRKALCERRSSTWKKDKEIALAGLFHPLRRAPDISSELRPLAADGNRSGGLLQEGPGFALGDAARWGHRRLAPATWRTGVASPSFCRPLLHPEFRVLDARADAQRPPPRAPRSLTRM